MEVVQVFSHNKHTTDRRQSLPSFVNSVAGSGPRFVRSAPVGSPCVLIFLQYLQYTYLPLSLSMEQF